MERLVARVKAVNRANDYANKLWLQLTDIFRPLVGQKLYKVDGTLLEKYKKLLPDFPCTPSLNVYRNAYGAYSLAWTVKTCESSPGSFSDYANYHETSVYIGDMKDGALTKISEQGGFKTDYSAEDIHAKRAAYKAAKELADKAANELYPFGEYERGLQ